MKGMLSLKERLSDLLRFQLSSLDNIHFDVHMLINDECERFSIIVNQWSKAISKEIASCYSFLA